MESVQHKFLRFLDFKSILNVYYSSNKTVFDIKKFLFRRNLIDLELKWRLKTLEFTVPQCCTRNSSFFIGFSKIHASPYTSEGGIYARIYLPSMKLKENYYEKNLLKM